MKKSISECGEAILQLDTYANFDINTAVPFEREKRTAKLCINNNKN